MVLLERASKKLLLFHQHALMLLLQDKGLETACLCDFLEQIQEPKKWCLRILDHGPAVS